MQLRRVDAFEASRKKESQKPKVTESEPSMDEPDITTIFRQLMRAVSDVVAITGCRFHHENGWC